MTDSSQPLTDEANRRSSERLEADEAATILFPNGRARVPCRVINYSDGGVLLRISASARLPNEFVLLTGVSENRRVCRVAWRIGSQTGCEFVNQFSSQGKDGDWVLPIAPERAQKVIKSRVLKRPLIIS